MILLSSSLLVSSMLCKFVELCCIVVLHTYLLSFMLIIYRLSDSIKYSFGSTSLVYCWIGIRVFTVMLLLVRP